MNINYCCFFCLLNSKHYPIISNRIVNEFYLLKLRQNTTKTKIPCKQKPLPPPTSLFIEIHSTQLHNINSSQENSIWKHKSKFNLIFPYIIYFYWLNSHIYLFFYRSRLLLEHYARPVYSNDFIFHQSLQLLTLCVHNKKYFSFSIQTNIINIIKIH